MTAILWDVMLCSLVGQTPSSLNMLLILSYSRSTLHTEAASPKTSVTNFESTVSHTRRQ